MRAALAMLAVVAALTAATSGTSQPEPQVSLSVTPLAGRQTSGRVPLGQREATISFRVSISSDQRCENLSVAYSHRTLFNGRVTFASAREFFDTGEPATSAQFAVSTTGAPAERIVVSARGTCELEDGTVLSASAPVTATVALPAHACDRGPLRVLALRGNATRSAGGTRYRVRAGDYLRATDAVAVGRHSRIVFGSTECRGLRVAAGGARAFRLIPGDYARRSNGVPTAIGAGGAADFRGDQHTGGVQTPEAIAVPRGARSAPSRIARFQIVSLAGSMTTVRVSSGAVYVAPRIGTSRYGKALVVRAGRTARCVGRSCS